ncbi:MAG: GxxExxY protein [Gemmatimonadetes bacterium]|nr:GxxExxY protein [Gemmatimonadota bacterium]
MASELRRLETDGITSTIIGTAIEVHRYLGPGMLEHTYEVCCEAGLKRRNLRVRRQVQVPIRYFDLTLDGGYRIDMLVEESVIVEVKAVKALLPVHVSQVLSYLRFADLHVGLLFNFNVSAPAAGGWKRILRCD